MLLQVNLKTSIALLYASALVFFLPKNLVSLEIFCELPLANQTSLWSIYWNVWFQAEWKIISWYSGWCSKLIISTWYSFHGHQSYSTSQILFSPICSLNEKPLTQTSKMIYLSRASLPMQTSWNRCLYVEGASAVHPSSVAKVLQDVLLWTTFLSFTRLYSSISAILSVFSGELRWLWIQSCWFQDYLVIFTW